MGTKFGEDTFPSDLMIGYGSLLSHHSRRQYSNIDCQAIPVTVQGWQRGWVTRAYHEKQT